MSFVKDISYEPRWKSETKVSKNAFDFSGPYW